MRLHAFVTVSLLGLLACATESVGVDGPAGEDGGDGTRDAAATDGAAAAEDARSPEDASPSTDGAVTDDAALGVDAGSDAGMAAAVDAALDSAVDGPTTPASTPQRTPLKAATGASMVAGRTRRTRPPVIRTRWRGSLRPGTRRPLWAHARWCSCRRSRTACSTRRLMRHAPPSSRPQPTLDATRA